MIIALLVDFILGFTLHKTRAWTMQFDDRIGDLMRYTIGLTGFILIAPLNIVLMHKKSANRAILNLYENTVVGMLLTAFVYGAGVVVGFVSDTE